MNEYVSFANGLAETWWTYVLHSTWQSLVVGVLVLAAVAALRRRSAPLRYGLLLVALAKFAVPPMLALPTGAFSMAATPVVSTAPVAAVEDVVSMPAPPVETSPARAWVAALESVASGETGEADVAPSSGLGEVPVPAAAPVRAVVSWKAWLMLLHGVGMAVLALAVLRACLQLRRHVRRGEVVTDGELFETWQRIRGALNVRRAVSLRVSEAADAPLAFGVFRPTVLIPAMLVRRLPAQQLAAVLAHELAHVRRRDAWAIWAENLLLMAWWFNPVLWVMIRALRRTREQCCDDAVLASRVADGETYCSSLVNAATHAAGVTRLNAALGMADGFHPLGRRIRRVMDVTLRRSPKLSMAGLAVVVLLGLLALPGLRVAKAQEQAPAVQAPAQSSAAVEQAAPTSTTPEASQSAPAPAAPEASQPAAVPQGDAGADLEAQTDAEIREHYAKADAEVQEYIRWTARTFSRGNLWYPADAFASLNAEEREQKIQQAAEVLQGEYGRHLCATLAEAGALKDKRLLPGLMKAAAFHRDDSDYDCRPKWMAVAALGRQDDISAAPTLVPLVDHGNQNVRMWARASLVRLTGQNFSADKQAWGKWWNESGNQPAIDLAQLKPWTPPAGVAAPTASGPLPQPAAAPDEVKKAAEGLPGKLMFEGQYLHRSRGGNLSEPGHAWVKKTDEGEIVTAVFLPAMRSMNVAYFGRDKGLYRYETYVYDEPRAKSDRSVMETGAGSVSIAHTGREKDGQTETYTLPEARSQNSHTRS